MHDDTIARLVRRYRSAAAAAAALGISRQALSAAMNRGHLSPALAAKAAAILAHDPAAPILDTAADLAGKLHITSRQTTNYAFSEPKRNCMKTHSITSPEIEKSLDLLRWVYAVANLRPDSPRFCWYVSRWAVPEKIAVAKNNGTFSALVANCPPLDPAWIRLVPPALDACRVFAETTSRPTKKATQHKPNGIHPIRNLKAA